MEYFKINLKDLSQQIEDQYEVLSRLLQDNNELAKIKATLNKIKYEKIDESTYNLDYFLGQPQKLNKTV